ncbi:MAG: hypothetical protein ACI3YK_00625 [Eubacteriales bacterium]
MQYKPNKNTKNAWVVVGFLSTMAFLFWLFGVLKWGYSVVNQSGLMIMAVADVLVIIRYLLNDYVYSINENGYFTVTRVTAKSNKLLADIRISADDRIVPGKKDMSEYGAIRKKENFAVSLFPKQTYYYLFRSGKDQDALILECGEDVAELIRQAIDTYGKMRGDEYEKDEDDKNGEDEG